MKSVVLRIGLTIVVASCAPSLPANFESRAPARPAASGESPRAPVPAPAARPALVSVDDAELTVAVDVRAERESDAIGTKAWLKAREFYEECLAHTMIGPEGITGRAMVRSMHFSDDTWMKTVLPLGEGRVCDMTAFVGPTMREREDCREVDDCYAFGCNHIDVSLPATPVDADPSFSACVARVVEQNLPPPEGGYLLVQVLVEAKPSAPR